MKLNWLNRSFRLNYNYFCLSGRFETSHKMADKQTHRKVHWHFSGFWAYWLFTNHINKNLKIKRHIWILFLKASMKVMGTYVSEISSCPKNASSVWKYPHFSDADYCTVIATVLNEIRWRLHKVVDRINYLVNYFPRSSLDLSQFNHWERCHRSVDCIICQENGISAGWRCLTKMQGVTIVGWKDFHATENEKPYPPYSYLLGQIKNLTEPLPRMGPSVTQLQMSHSHEYETSQRILSEQIMLR